MLKLLVIGAFLCQEISCKSVDQQPVGLNTNAPPQNLATLITSTIRAVNQSNGNSEPKHNSDGAQQVIYSYGPLLLMNQTYPQTESNVSKKVRTDYEVVSGVGAYKLHLRLRSWNKARRICIDEGGHLAVIKSDAEREIVRKMLVAASNVERAWVGFHDRFEEGDWFSIHDDPLGPMDWYPWSKHILDNPDNSNGKENCGSFLRDRDCLNDDNCERETPFVCQISLK